MRPGRRGVRRRPAVPARRAAARARLRGHAGLGGRRRGPPARPPSRRAAAPARSRVVTGDGSVGSGATCRPARRGPRARRRRRRLRRRPTTTLAAVAAAAERRGAWSQVALETPMACGTGLCQGCPVPVVAEDGVARRVRACVDGPVIRGDRVHWGTGSPVTRRWAVMVASGCGGTGRELAPYADLERPGLRHPLDHPRPRPGGAGAPDRRDPQRAGARRRPPEPRPRALPGHRAALAGARRRPGARVGRRRAIGEYAELARRLSRAPGVAGLEVNLGAPDQAGEGLFEVREPYHAASVVAAVGASSPPTARCWPSCVPTCRARSRGPGPCTRRAQRGRARRRRPGRDARRARRRAERAGDHARRAALRARGGHGAARRRGRSAAAASTAPRPRAPSSPPAPWPSRSAPRCSTTRRPWRGCAPPCDDDPGTPTMTEDHDDRALRRPPARGDARSVDGSAWASTRTRRCCTTGGCPTTSPAWSPSPAPWWRRRPRGGRGQAAERLLRALRQPRRGRARAGRRRLPGGRRPGADGRQARGHRLDQPGLRRRLPRPRLAAGLRRDHRQPVPRVRLAGPHGGDRPAARRRGLRPRADLQPGGGGGPARADRVRHRRRHRARPPAGAQRGAHAARRPRRGHRRDDRRGDRGPRLQRPRPGPRVRRPGRHGQRPAPHLRPASPATCCPASSREVLAAGPDPVALRDAARRGNDAVAVLGDA